MKNVLVLCDSPWHPAEVIELGLAPLEGDEFHFVFVRAAKDILTPARIAEYPLILCCKGNSVTEANNAPWFEDGVTEVGPKEFEAYVKAGGGFLAVHAGTIGKKDTPYGQLIGCEFNGHPPRCGVEVRITGKHPITEGVEARFDIRDEHYQTQITADDATELFRTVSESGGEQAGGYVRTLGSGRMCVMTPGHTVDVWYHKAFKKLLVNAMRWCLGAD
ncbi:MAG: ThuA domain-containing protein [Clostridiales bacterium]|jgi:hypothetical protein|nr:ThuA domain-containing protein [Clostridiales bacterium]